jgi:hypothetical protein
MAVVRSAWASLESALETLLTYVRARQLREVSIHGMEDRGVRYSVVLRDPRQEPELPGVYQEPDEEDDDAEGA